MAHHYGYGAVRTRPLCAREFNLWWVALDRYNLMQSDEGRKQIATRRGLHLASALDAAVAAGPDALSGEYGTAAMRAHPPIAGLDPATARVPWDDPARMLALLAPDDPRAAFLRAGGRMDASGDPILRDAPMRASSPPTPPPWRGPS